MKRVFVVEKDGVPIERDGGLHVETMPTPSMAKARMEVTPIPRLASEKIVPYVSVEDLEELLQKPQLLVTALEDALQRLIAEAYEGLR